MQIAATNPHIAAYTNNLASTLASTNTGAAQEARTPPALASSSAKQDESTPAAAAPTARINELGQTVGGTINTTA